MKRTFLLFATLLLGLAAIASKNDSTETKAISKIYTYDIKDEIGPGVWRSTQKAFAEAKAQQADLVLIHMNTYGGLVDMADSIRTKILNSDIPVWVFIDNNAASAGALISIACDKIFMSEGANIGAASVVTQSGELAPDKYQSYMRSTMRATAEATGRNPKIAEAMVDGQVVVEGVNKEGQVVTFTTREAIKNGFCNAQASSIEEVLEINDIETYEITELKIGTVDKMIGFLINPAISGILILLILGGIYYELQTPGLGFPIIAAIIGALLYFAPLYLEGLAANWEILIFFVGLILLGLEIFVIPGFGIAGVLGIVIVAGSLTLSLVRNINFDFTMAGSGALNRALLIVLFALIGFVVFTVVLGRSALRSVAFKKIALNDTLKEAKARETLSKQVSWKGQQGIAIGDLRPSGKIAIDDQEYDAASLGEFIPAGSTVEIIKEKAGTLIVKLVK